MRFHTRLPGLDQFRTKIFVGSSVLLTFGLTGCWTPPNGNVQPKGEPRLIQSGVQLESSGTQAIVMTIDEGQRTLSLRLENGGPIFCQVGPRVKNFSQVRPGDKITVKLTEEFAIYVLKNGKLSGSDGTEQPISVDARVQSVDPSFRVLTLQYPNGRTQVFKAGLAAKLLEMQPGDSAVLESAVVQNMEIEKGAGEPDGENFQNPQSR